MSEPKKHTGFMDSIVVTGIALAAIYWVCESFMYFFLRPEANFIQHLLGPDKFEIFTRLLVLCLFAIFSSIISTPLTRAVWRTKPCGKVS